MRALKGRASQAVVGERAARVAVRAERIACVSGLSVRDRAHPCVPHAPVFVLARRAGKCPDPREVRRVALGPRFSRCGGLRPMSLPSTSRARYLRSCQLVIMGGCVTAKMVDSVLEHAAPEPSNRAEECELCELH